MAEMTASTPVLALSDVGRLRVRHAVETIVGDPSIADNIKRDLRAAKTYAEGTGLRVDVRDGSRLPDIERLIDIKLAH